MKRKIEGILISKIPYADKHLICKFLLRNGKMVSVLFYGGQGSSKKKSGTLELGFLLAIELSQSRGGEELYRAKEWIPTWYHTHIREEIKAFNLMCFYMEMVSKLSVHGDLHDEFEDSDDSMVFLFRLLSNGLFSMDNKLKTKTFESESELLLFLGKLLVEGGVFPRRDSCLFCERPLHEVQRMNLMAEKGGFSCHYCHEASSSSFGRAIWEVLGEISQRKYQDYVFKGTRNTLHELSASVLHYFFYQFQLNKGHFKTLPMVL